MYRYLASVILSIAPGGASLAAEPPAGTSCAAALSGLPEALGAASSDAQCPGGEREASLFRAYAEFRTSDNPARSATALKKALQRYDDAGGPPSRLVGLTLIAIAERLLADGNEHAFERAARAEEVLAATAPDDISARAGAIRYQAAARLLKRRTFSSDIADAFGDATRARRLFSGDDMQREPSFLETVAWQAAILGLAAGNRRVVIDEGAAREAMAVLSPPECDPFWRRGGLAAVKRKASWAGSLMSYRRFLGVIVKIDLDEQGRASLESVAAEAAFPSKTGRPEAAARARDKSITVALDRWELESSAPLQCRAPTLVPLAAFLPEADGGGVILRDWPLNYQGSTE